MIFSVTPATHCYIEWHWERRTSECGRDEARVVCPRWAHPVTRWSPICGIDASGACRLARHEMECPGCKDVADG